MTNTRVGDPDPLRMVYVMCHTVVMTSTATPIAAVVALPVDLIIAGDNDRTSFDDAGLRSLADSIGQSGLAQAITVRAVGPDRYEIVAGERRYRAVAHVLGWSHIDAVIREYDDQTAADVMLTENLARVDLDPIDEAEAYQRRIDQGQTVDDIAKVAGVAAFRVKWRLELLGLTTMGRHMLRAGQIDVGLARELAGLNENRQAMVLHTLAREALTGPQSVDLCRRMKEAQKQDSLFDPNNFMQLDEWVDDVKRRTLGKAGLTKLVGRLVDALAPLADPDDPDLFVLLGEARAVVESSAA